MPALKKSRRWHLLAYAALLIASHIWRALHPVAPDPSAHQHLAPLSETPLSYADVPSTSYSAPSPIPVILLHGSPMASACFTEFVPFLSGDFRLIIPDLSGFGNSRAPLPGPAHSAKALSALLDHLEIPSAHIVGYSMGGAVAIELQRFAPEKIHTLTLLGAVGVQEHELLGDYALNRAVHGLQLLALKAVQELIPHFGLIDRSLINVAYAQNFFRTDQRPYRKILASIPPSTPVLILHAEDDILVPVSAALEHARIIPHSETAISESGGHMAVMTSPETIAAPLHKFLHHATPTTLPRSPQRSSASHAPFPASTSAATTSAHQASTTSSPAGTSKSSS